MTATFPDALSVDALPLGQLPLVDDLGITQALDELLPKAPRSKGSGADCVLAMVRNTLEGRTARHRMEPWTDRLPVDVRIGLHSEPEDVSDARLARTLDPLFKAGTDAPLVHHREAVPVP